MELITTSDIEFYCEDRFFSCKNNMATEDRGLVL
jgi:hypothetical protein